MPLSELIKNFYDLLKMHGEFSKQKTMIIFWIGGGKEWRRLEV